MKYPRFLSAIALVLAAMPSSGSAWEANTHAGLTEQAALQSALHTRLHSQFGLDQGLFQGLIVAPADAPELLVSLRAFNPTHGYVPDSRGRLTALGWLAAGSVLADSPPGHAAHHFFDPTTGKGLSDATVRGLAQRLHHSLYTRLAGASITRSGMPAIEWVTHPDNPMNLAGFFGQYTSAVTARTPAERQRNVAGALVAAGALLHVLQDMGSPSHVRDDLAAHLDVVGNDTRDTGSRFERVAAVAYGRLGVPAAPTIVTRPSLRAFFTAGDRGGLADRTAVRWFSSHTLPRSIRIRPGAGSSAIGQILSGNLARPLPAPSTRLDMRSAQEQRGARLLDNQGVCVADYQLRRNTLSWYIEDDCMAEQVAVILPEVTGYSAGLLDFLFRATIALERKGKQIHASSTGADLGAGTFEVFWDDETGNRTRYGKTVSIKQANHGEVFAVLPRVPGRARAVAALYRGVDKNGQTVTVAGYLSLAQPSAKTNNAQKVRR
ncbi:MAG: hypothetical protein MJE77_39735 [Proteobacteria bacterium]|nr:hypothetical protein [Pseudomonadota bacterium]